MTLARPGEHGPRALDRARAAEFEPGSRYVARSAGCGPRPRVFEPLVKPEDPPGRAWSQWRLAPRGRQGRA